MNVALKITGLSMLILILLCDAVFFLLLGSWWYVFPLGTIAYIAFTMEKV